MKTNGFAVLMAVFFLSFAAEDGVSRDLGHLVKKRRFTIINLTLGAGGDTGGAEGINDDGWVVGYANSSPGSNSYNAFVYDAKGGFRFLPTLPGGRNTSAVSINKDGQSVGTTELNHQIRALLWQKSGDLVDLHPGPEWTESGVSSINDNGQVVGYARKPGETVAFIFSARDGYLYPSNVSVIALNDPGALIGDAAGPVYAKSLDEELHHVNLPENFGAFRLLADNGLIAGVYQNDDGYQQAFRFHPKHRVVPLKNLPGTLGSFPLGINDHNQIVGMPDQAVGAVLWEHNKAYNLNELVPPGSSWVLLARAAAINNHGWIVGYGTTTNSSAAYLLKPEGND
jgi:probable HAF family extracellular repeat protein